MSSIYIFRQCLLSQIFTHYKTYWEPRNIIISVYSLFWNLFHILNFNFCRVGFFRLIYSVAHKFHNFCESVTAVTASFFPLYFIILKGFSLNASKKDFFSKGWLSFKTQFKMDYPLQGTRTGKVFGIMPAIISSECRSIGTEGTK